jgi:hypothetical protein
LAASGDEDMNGDEIMIVAVVFLFVVIIVGCLITARNRGSASLYVPKPGPVPAPKPVPAPVAKPVAQPVAKLQADAKPKGLTEPVRKPAPKPVPAPVAKPVPVAPTVDPVPTTVKTDSHSGTGIINNASLGTSQNIPDSMSGTSFVSDVSREMKIAVAERDGWICQLCREPIDRNLDYDYNNRSPRRLEIDHINPRANEGGSEMWNRPGCWCAGRTAFTAGSGSSGATTQPTSSSR